MRLTQRLELARNKRAFARVPDVPGLDTRVLATPLGAIRAVVAGKDAGAPTLLLSMDPPMTLEHEADTLRALAERYRVVAFEVPGFGFSRMSEAFSFSLEDCAASFGHVLDATERASAVLCSPCFNNLPALGFALAQPARVAGFVGIQAPSWPDAVRWTKRMDPARLFMLPVFGQLLTWAFSFELQKAWLKIAEPDAARRAGYIALARELHGSGALYCLASGVQATRRPDPFEGKRLACPAALLWGAADKSHRPTPPDSFARYLADPRVIIAPEAGHFPELSAPPLLIEAVRHVAG